MHESVLSMGLLCCGWVSGAIAEEDERGKPEWQMREGA
jgi:hypothetical protein